MNRRLRCGAVLLLLTLLAAACGAKRVDLLPVGQAGPSGAMASCARDAEGHLMVEITNRGGAFAHATTTVVEFESRWPVILPTRPVGPGQTSRVILPLPDSCAQGCRFKITADALNEVEETDEGNNTLSGRCR